MFANLRLPVNFIDEFTSFFYQVIHVISTQQRKTGATTTGERNNLNSKPLPFM